MARYKQSVFGKISGKYGNAVAAVRKDGMCILKEYRIASNPNTPGQQSQRGKFGFTMKKLNFMRLLFTDIYSGQYGINKAVALAMKTCVHKDDDGFYLHAPDLIISDGKLSPPQSLKIDRIDAAHIQLYWCSTGITSEKENDELNVVCVNFNLNKLTYTKCVAQRSDNHVLIEIPSVSENREWHLWLFFKSARRNEYSPSVYFPLYSLL